ncbi:pyridine nucleotide-disulfide oxidoreductase [Saccharomonospora sp. CUA-673]|uniref:NAD(P)/FAD-dependent oxidoreductase n=1 Tax=Saccharomonospora sp. CUA-673 TaxID=1904969 RepID=UPI000968AA0D|nr:NAD(P)/FAD-dependent oxidoreductase [Saccharomonospora sp. CUA-673]OLT46095.1 pyridine nucleotide-disulfide oxidoreductase [Saccharomonospora sp. CUA-673]
MYDVIVIGGGPAGLSAALVLGRQRRQVLVVDGGEVRNAPADEMHMYLSRDGFSPHDMLALGRDELAGYPGVERRSAQVSDVAGAIDEFTVTFDDGSVAKARRLILATGLVDEPFDVPGVRERFGSSVFHCPFCHGYETTGKTLAVLGRDVPQVMLALYVGDRYSDDVVVVTDGPHELPTEVTDRLEAHGVEIRTEALTKVTGELDGLVLHFADGSVLERQAMFHRAPTRQRSPLAQQLGCEMFDDGSVRVDEFQATTVPGVSAAGDMARLPALPDALTLVSQAAADGVRAAVWLEQGMFRASLQS